MSEEQTFLDFIRYRNMVAVRKARLRRLGKAPAHGVFYYIDGEVFAHPEPVQSAERGGDFAYPKVDHYDYWQVLIKMIPQFRKVWGELSYMYTAFPRGRIVYNWRNNSYKVFLCPEIPNSAHPKIIAEFGLHGENVAFDVSDEHYIRDESDVEVVEYLLKSYGIDIKVRAANRKGFRTMTDEACALYLARRKSQLKRN